MGLNALFTELDRELCIRRRLRTSRLKSEERNIERYKCGKIFVVYVGV